MSILHFTNRVAAILATTWISVSAYRTFAAHPGGHSDRASDAHDTVLNDDQWVNAATNQITRGTFLSWRESVRGTIVRVQRTDGSTHEIALADLNDESRQRANAQIARVRGINSFSRIAPDGADTAHALNAYARVKYNPAWVSRKVDAVNVEYRTFHSAAAGGDVSFHVYVPPTYRETGGIPQRFPVVLWLHGSGGGLPGIPLIASAFDRAISEGKMPPALVVFVNGLAEGMYVDWKDGTTLVETVIIKDLIPFIDAEYRTIASREARVLDGFSMGGYGSARLGFKYPSMFRAVSMLGAGPMQERLIQTPRAGRQRAAEVLSTVYGGDQEYFHAVSPRQLAEQNVESIASSLIIRVVVGEDDETFENNARFHDHLTGLKIPHEWRSLPGVAHDTKAVLNALGDDQWAFYLRALSTVDHNKGQTRSTSITQAAPFNAFSPFVKTRWDDRWLYIESDGLPHTPPTKNSAKREATTGTFSHPVMVGITAWQQQVPLPQAYTGDNAWHIPLKPVLAEKPVSAKDQLFRGAIALAANGVPIFNPIKNDGRTDTLLAGELDQFGGHCGRADDYHYHIAPTHLQKYVGKDLPIAYALDGFPIFGYFDPKAPAGADRACPIGSTDPLDWLNGHFAPASTPGEKGLYHYHASEKYPYLNGGMRGVVTVADDQIEPQPRARPVRDWLQPLRGAKITDFKAVGELSWSLKYEISGKAGYVNYRIEGRENARKAVFEFIETDGTKRTETFSTSDDRRDRSRGRDGGQRRGRNEDAGKPPQRGPDANRPSNTTGFTLLSESIKDGRLSVECTCDATSGGVSPALSFKNLPSGTKALAVTIHHIPPNRRDNAAAPEDEHVYLVMYNLPAETSEIRQGTRPTGTNVAFGMNTVNRKMAYAPPCSKGPGDKTYTITAYALNAEVTLKPELARRGVTKAELLEAIKASTLATSSLDMVYARASDKSPAGEDRKPPQQMPPDRPSKKPAKNAIALHEIASDESLTHSEADPPVFEAMQHVPSERRRELIKQTTGFQTDVPATPFSIILVRPTSTSMTVSVTSNASGPVEGCIEFTKGDPNRAPSTFPERSKTATLDTGVPTNFELTGLTPATTYWYRFVSRDTKSKAEANTRSDPYAFRTQVPVGVPFTFTMTADTHLDPNMTPAVYRRAMLNALSDRPDLHIDLGDTFMVDKRREFTDAQPQYLAQRYYFGLVGVSAPVFLVLGNHDGEVGYAARGLDSMAQWSFQHRTKFFPPPTINTSAATQTYTGKTDLQGESAGNWYSFTWGDARFIALDPFWPTTSRPRGPRGQVDKKDADTAATDENWARSLGNEQYLWLTRTLETNSSKYTFVFIHHLVGGIGKANRGGVAASTMFEWGGRSADDTNAFASKRPGWAMPIHDLLVKHKVSAVFHGHDHLYVRDERDGLIYQCVPQPGNVAGGTRSAAEYGYTSGTILASPGHLRVRVTSDEAIVEFIRAADADENSNRRDIRRKADEPNQTIVHRYSIKPRR